MVTGMKLCTFEHDCPEQVGIIIDDNHPADLTLPMRQMHESFSAEGMLAHS
jgi:hypothetical protein